MAFMLSFFWSCWKEILRCCSQACSRTVLFLETTASRAFRSGRRWAALRATILHMLLDAVLARRSATFISTDRRVQDWSVLHIYLAAFRFFFPNIFMACAGRHAFFMA